MLTTLLLLQAGYAYVPYSSLESVTGASRNTLKQHFRDLTERNHLEQHGSGRGV